MALHGLVRPRETSLPRGALALSGKLDLGSHRSLVPALSRRSARARWTKSNRLVNLSIGQAMNG
jgi:hypothetical protein